ncbi:MAG TPA: hypothetical protein EYM38_00320 [Dehalococcoidia bacterium]|nr:hypothetical protein [Dehalococcoidia bacterium]
MPTPTATSTPTPTPILTLSPTAIPMPIPAPTYTPTLADLVERVSPSIVRIDTSHEVGPDFIFDTSDPSGPILGLTNAHVIGKETGSLSQSTILRP